MSALLLAVRGALYPVPEHNAGTPYLWTSWILDKPTATVPE